MSLINYQASVVTETEKSSSLNVRSTHVSGETVELPTFDLSYVVEQVLQEQAKKGNESITESQVQDCVRKYRNYLALCKMYPGKPLMPCEDIDLIWHQHILNSQHYMDDCDSYLGYYLHHNPILPTKEVALNSGELYVKHFGPEEGYENKGVVMCCCSPALQ